MCDALTQQSTSTHGSDGEQVVVELPSLGGELQRPLQVAAPQTQVHDRVEVTRLQVSLLCGATRADDGFNEQRREGERARTERGRTFRPEHVAQSCSVREQAQVHVLSLAWDAACRGRWKRNIQRRLWRHPLENLHVIKLPFFLHFGTKISSSSFFFLKKKGMLYVGGSSSSARVTVTAAHRRRV